MVKKAIIIGINSTIGSAIANELLAQSVQVLGSYRSPATVSDSMKAISLPLDLTVSADISAFIEAVNKQQYQWDYLIFCSGTMEPIGAFEQIDFTQWSDNITVNLIHQIKLLHGLLPLRHQCPGLRPTVLSLAGGGVNGAPENYSAYTLAKIGLIKITELLATEIPSVNFVNLGPGWVDTPIHQETLNAADKAGSAYRQTQRRLQSKDFVPMKKVVASVLTLLADNTDIYSGRNFSAADDPLGSQALQQVLEETPDMYKLRRYNNEWH